MNLKKYKSVRIRASTYKRLKFLAVRLEVPIVQLIDKLLNTYKDEPLSETEQLKKDIGM